MNELCDDEIDNDSNGLIDSEDNDCEIICSNVEERVRGVNGNSYGLLREEYKK